MKDASNGRVGLTVVQRTDGALRGELERVRVRPSLRASARDSVRPSGGNLQCGVHGSGLELVWSRLQVSGVGGRNARRLVSAEVVQDVYECSKHLRFRYEDSLSGLGTPEGR